MMDSDGPRSHRFQPRTMRLPVRPGAYSLGLVGFPIDKSLSPLMHEAALAHHGLEGSYRRFDAPALEDLARAFKALELGSLHGFNVTLPWKLDAARLVVEHGGVLCGAAAHLEVANTIVMRQTGDMARPTRLEGHNTDVAGLVAAIRERWPALRDPVAPASRASVLGAGGAAYAAVLALRELGFQEVRIWNRTAPAAHRLVSKLNMGHVVTDIEQATSKAALVLQATTLGMGESGDDYRELVDFAMRALDGTAEDARIVDLVYHPRPTVWVAAANALGREADDGLSMLIHQAALAFSLWTGHPPPVAVMRQAVEPVLGA